MNVKTDVEAFIRENFFYEGPALDPQTSFLETGIIDSTGVLELVGFLEERYGIGIEDEDLTPENLDSLERIAGFVDRKKARAEA